MGHRGGAILQGLAAHCMAITSLVQGDRTEVVLGVMVSGNYFEVVGVRALPHRQPSSPPPRLPLSVVAVRIALGASRGRRGFQPEALPIKVSLQLPVDLRVALYTLALSGASALLFVLASHHAPHHLCAPPPQL